MKRTFLTIVPTGYRSLELDKLRWWESNGWWWWCWGSCWWYKKEPSRLLLSPSPVEEALLLSLAATLRWRCCLVTGIILLLEMTRAAVHQVRVQCDVSRHRCKTWPVRNYSCLAAAAATLPILYPLESVFAFLISLCYYYYCTPLCLYYILPTQEACW